MFPNLFSSSCEISSKCNAFVQNKDDGNEGLVPLRSVVPIVKVPEMWDELLVNSGEMTMEEVPNLTVITDHPSLTHQRHVRPSQDCDADVREGSVKNTGVLSLVDSNNIRDNTVRCKEDRNYIPLTNDDDDTSFKHCDYYSRWGIERGRLLGGGESGVAAAGTQSWGQTGGQSGGWAGNQSTGPTGGGPAPPQGYGGRQQQQQQNNTQSQAGPSSQQSQAQGAGNQQVNANQPNSQPPSSNNQQNNQQGNNPGNQPGPNNQPTGPQSNNNPTANANNNQQPNNQPGNQSGNQTQPPNSNQQNNNNWNSKPGQQPASTKQQMEQLNSMREALFSQDGWGGQNVNQDSNWDIPGSPEPGAKDQISGAPPPIWKPNVNNGTDLWEANLRNGGVVAPPAAPAPKAPISHTPTSHIGGVWGEEDEGDFSNMWTGVPPAGGQTGGGPPQWPGGPGPQPPAVWPGASGKKEGEWGGPAGGGAAAGWTDQRHDMRTDVARCDQRGISGRLNGEAMWPHHHHKVPGGGAGGPAGGAGGWGAAAPPIKDMSALGKPSGWEEPSPPATRRTMPNYDDGTSLWGQQNRPAMPGQGKVSHWKDIPSGGQPMGRGGMQCPPVRNPTNIKPEQGPVWHPPTATGGGAPRNGWEPSMEPCWGEDKPAPWLDPSAMLPGGWQGKPKPPWEQELEQNPPSWGVHPGKQPASKANKDYIWTRTYRMLSDMGYKKDDMENAMRNNSMGVDDPMDPSRSEVWGGGRRGGHDGLDGGEPHGGLFGGGGPAQVCPPFPMGGPGGGPSSGPPLQQPVAARQQPTQQPSAQQLRMLVQQIQMAVQAGYLQQQILNQPLAPQTLLLLNQLLQQIKVLQHFQQVYQSQQNPLKNVPNHILLQTQVKLTQTKQQIGNLQNQIASQQAIHMKQQAQQIPPPPQQQSTDLFRSNMHDPLSAIQSNFTDMSLKDSPMVNPLSYSQTGGTGQSRLNQWKLPVVLDKEGDVVGAGGGEFSRAPGSKGAGGGNGGSPLLPDGSWSSRDNQPPASWPPSEASSDPSDPTKDWPSATQPPAFSDLVPEFKPGEPWKGNPMKTTDDDPTLTPSSIVRSPLVLPSMNVKDSHILGPGSVVPGKSSPTSSDLISTIPSLSLSTSTWTFNPPTQPQTSTSSMLNKLSATSGAGSKASGGWGETGGGGELWNVGGGKGRPPPGLGVTKPQTTPTSTNGWSTPRWSQSTTSGQPSNWSASTWLLLRNLTPQIDGSTLKTLCIQHGPLISFHLFLNNGIALARYSSREEAQKAQGALNNCVLGNTTIFAENPSDSDVMPLVTHLQNQGGGGSGGGAGGGSGAGAAPTAGGGSATPWRTPTPASSAASQLWSSSTSSLWGADTPTTTNSSFLPADLGGESM